MSCLQVVISCYWSLKGQRRFFGSFELLLPTSFACTILRLSALFIGFTNTTFRDKTYRGRNLSGQNLSGQKTFRDIIYRGGTTYRVECIGFDYSFRRFCDAAYCFLWRTGEGTYKVPPPPAKSWEFMLPVSFTTASCLHSWTFYSGRFACE
jgi:hypothetical protein